MLPGMAGEEVFGSGEAPEYPWQLKLPPWTPGAVLPVTGPR